MMDSRAKSLIERKNRMAGERGVWENHWQEIAELMSPDRADFTGYRTPGEKRMEKIHDGTALLSSTHLGSGLWGMLTSSTNDWFGVESEIAELNKDYSVKVWCAETSRRMRSVFASHGQAFYSAALDYLYDVPTLGTGVFYTDEEVGKANIFFSCRHLAECYIAENDRERVDFLVRKFQWTARQAVKRWRGACSKAVLDAAEKQPERKFNFLHGVMPIDEWDGKRTNKPFASVYVDEDAGQILAEGGYFDFPYQVARWSTRSRGVYGDGAGMIALPDTKMVNAMSITTIRAAQKTVDPTLLAPDEDAISGIRTSPGGIIYGGVDMRGNQLVRPLVTGADVGLGIELTEQRRTAIREAFYWSLLMMVDKANMTATEIVSRNEEKMNLMGPQLGRLQTEFLDPLITRVFGIMMRAGALSPPPAILQQYPGLSIQYLSPMARIQRAGEASATMRTLEVAGQMGQANPEIWDKVDTDAALDIMSSAFGAPPELLRPPEAVEQIRAGRRQQQNLAAATGAAKPVAGAVKDLAQAAAMGQQPPAGAA